MRVIVAELPRLLSDIVEGIVSAESDIEVVEVLGSDLAQAVRDTGADAVVTVATSDSAPVTALLQANPRLRVVAVAEDGHTGWLWVLRPHREWVGELSARRLVLAIRTPLADAPDAHRGRMN